MQNPGPSIDDLTYDWPPSLDQYESRVFLGLSAVEAIAGAMGFLIPIALIPTAPGLFLGLLGGMVVLLAVKKLEALGDLSIPTYLIARWLDARGDQSIELPLIMGGSSGTIEMATWEGEVLLTLEDETH